MFERIKNLVIKEFIHYFREKRTVFFLFATPLIQIILFGYVATMDVTNVSTALYDLDRSSESRDFARRLESSGYFTIKHLPGSPGEIRELIDKGDVLCAIQINRGFGKDLQKGIPTEIQVIVDGTDSNTALIAMGYVNRIIGKYSMDMSKSSINANLRGLDLQSRVWYNPDLRSRNYMVPGVIALIVMITCLLLTSMSVVREREVGTMEQLMVTPLRPVELIIGKTIPAAIVGYVDMTLVTVLGVFWFDVPIHGALILLVLCTGAYLLSVLGIGLFISTIAKTQQQAMTATFFFLQPAILLSGFATPIDTMPAVFQYITYFSPLRYFLIIVRGIFLKGVGINILWPQIAALLVLGIAILAASVLRFKKRMV
jgi:ABC-2 type transport system permease protein